MKLCVLGAGAWGTALALTASRHHDAVLYARSSHQAALLCAARENQRYLPGIVLPENLAVTSDIEEALDHIDLLVIATPLAGLRPAATLCALHTKAPVVWLCKGFEEGSALLPHEVMHAAWPQARGAALLGPSFALEVARGQPTALTVASSDQLLAARVVQAFHHDALRVYTTDDLIGVEVGGAIKNVLAIATGICDGLSLGLNARAALITRGLAEMMRLGQALGARPDTLTGLTGLGDLILTCTGALSRNRQVGLALGQGQTLDATLQQLGHVAEGVRCSQAVVLRARAAGVEMPIATAVSRVLFENLSPRDAVAGLLARAARAES